MKEEDKVTNTATVTQTTDEVNPKLIALVADQITALNGTIIRFTIAMVILMVLSLGSITFSIITYLKADSVEHTNSLTRKYVWELKKSLDLKFSDERSNATD